MATARKINPEGLEELVEELIQHERHHGSQFGPMVGLLQEVSETLSDLKGIKTQEEFQLALERIRTLQEEIRTAFQEFCRKNGTTLEEAYRYLETPQNFNQKQWEEIQFIRRKVEEKALTSEKTKK